MTHAQKVKLAKQLRKGEMNPAFVGAPRRVGLFTSHNWLARKANIESRIRKQMEAAAIRREERRKERAKRHAALMASQQA